MPRDHKPKRTDDDAGYEDGGDVELCPVCRQEYSNGICPIRSADCPYVENDVEEDLLEEDDEN